MARPFIILCLTIVSATYVSAGYDLQRNIPESASALVAQSKKLRLDKQDINVAEQILKEVIVKYPDYYKAHYNLGLVYQEKNDYAAAIQELEKARTIREKQKLPEYSIYNTLGWIYMLNGDNKKAENCFMTAVKHESKNTTESNRRLYNNLALFYYNLGKVDEAKKYVDIAEQKYQSKSAEEMRTLIEQLVVDRQKIDIKSNSLSGSQSPTPHK